MGELSAPRDVEGNNGREKKGWLFLLQIPDRGKVKGGRRVRLHMCDVGNSVNLFSVQSNVISQVVIELGNSALF